MGFWKERLPKVLFDPINEFKRDFWGNPKTTFSGEGEDLILNKLFGKQDKGVYVDVGCYHPKVGSNTEIFYQRGWTGINIDPNPLAISKFQNYRPKDFNINAGIASVEDQLAYYMFEEPAINTFSAEVCNQRIEKDGQKFIGKKIISTHTLEYILDKYLNNRQIDFLDIDTEGLDLDVLKSNNWDKYRPRIILVEDQYEQGDSFETLSTYQYLLPKGYRLIAKTVSTLIFETKY